VVDSRHWADNTYIPLSCVGPDRHTWIAQYLAPDIEIAGLEWVPVGARSMR